MSNSITTYQENTLDLTVQIIDIDKETINFSGYTAIMAINTVISKIYITGSTITTGGTTTFIISSEKNNLKPDVYEYEIYLNKHTNNYTNNYTVIKDSYTVLSRPSYLD
jgi:hypothetical protein